MSLFSDMSLPSGISLTVALRMLARKLLLPVALAAIACTNAMAAEELASIVRGGRLYDDWAKEVGANAVRVQERSAETSRARPQRCVDCHGWDYRGRDGHGNGGGPAQVLAKGIQGMKGGDLAAVRAVLVNETHAYGDFLTKPDLDDIAIFVVKGQVLMDEFIDPVAGYSKGHAPRGNIYYQTICANCHGNDGQQIADGPPLGELGRSNPWRALHTLMNGHPNGNMPALRVVGMPLLLDMLSYVQGLPRRDLLTSVARGGRLYDTWYKENGTSPPKTQHPAYPGTLTNVEPRTTWRCKACHGWDYGGVTLASSSMPGLRALAGQPAKVIQARLRNKTHSFGTMLSERDFADLANFISDGLTDTDSYIDRATRKAKSDGQAYAAHYQTVCASCHGGDGREIRTQPPLGRVANAEPWRALHSIINGHSGEAMPALVAFPRDMAGGILAYIQNLPQQR